MRVFGFVMDINHINFFALLYLIVNHAHTIALYINLNNIGADNIRNLGMKIKVLNRTGFLMCARQCERTPLCVGFNYMKSLLLCEIIGYDYSYTEYVEGWKYVSNLTWLTDTGASTLLRGSGPGCYFYGIQVRLTSGVVYCVRHNFPQDCSDDNFIPPEAKSGEYHTEIDSTNRKSVYCDMETDGGGWTVFQSRKDGSTDFYMTWYKYKFGFGNAFTDFWLGNSWLHRILSTHNYMLRIDMENYQGVRNFAQYSKFYVAGEDNKFKITVTGFSGDTVDGFGSTNGLYFSTKDRDNDIAFFSCSNEYKGGWWYGMCHVCNLNGIYGNISGPEGIHWMRVSDSTSFTLKTVSMKIKRMG